MISLRLQNTHTSPMKPIRALFATNIKSANKKDQLENAFNRNCCLPTKKLNSFLLVCYLQVLHFYRVYHTILLLLLRWVYLGENQFFFSEPSEIENSNKSLLKWKLGKSFVENWKGYFLLHAQMLLWKELKRWTLKRI